MLNAPITWAKKTNALQEIDRGALGAKEQETKNREKYTEKEGA